MLHSMTGTSFRVICALRLSHKLMHNGKREHSQVNPEPELEVLQGDPVSVFHQVAGLVHIPVRKQGGDAIV